MHVVLGRRVTFIVSLLGIVALGAPGVGRIAGAADETGRWKLDGTNCYWDEFDEGPDQCNPNGGRYKLGSTGCYWDPWDTGPNQCSPTVGRWKWDGVTCYWDANDSGPHQCNPDSPPPNGSPSVTLTEPANGASYTEPATITLTANASDPEGWVTQVDFFLGATLIGTDTTAPYSYVLSNVGAGSYVLTARATDNAGATTTSAGVSISVGSSAQANVQATFNEAPPAPTDPQWAIGCAVSASAPGQDISITGSYTWSAPAGNVLGQEWFNGGAPDSFQGTFTRSVNATIDDMTVQCHIDVSFSGLTQIIPRDSQAQVPGLGVPTGETTVSSGWHFPSDTAHRWTQTLMGGNFADRRVWEEDGGGGQDNCWFPESAMAKYDSVTGAGLVLSVGTDNKWGPDIVGWNPSPVEYYRNQGRAPCDTSFRQDMWINPISTPRKYVSNVLRAGMTNTTVWSERAGQYAERIWP